ncbi:MAG: 50S ribosomal protein L25/general stress protein Ctc [Gammaproteobacteria bacterium]|nr:50S ribosomal protein L25/general stress protein Ctc [Gammaproteobacteria bacterium]
MNNFEIVAETRDVKGKGASRRLRRDGKVPAILYGAGSEPVAIQIAHQEMLQQTGNEAFYSTILTLKLNGTAEKVVIKDLQRHAYKATIMHMDFQRVDEAAVITMRVPIHFINEEHCVGVRTGGGIISHVLTELEITCLPKDLPEYIEVDVQALELGEAIHVSDLVMPEGAAITALQHGGDGSGPVVSVQMPKLVIEDLEEEAAEAEDLEGVELAEGEEAPAEDSDEAARDKTKEDK